MTRKEKENILDRLSNNIDKFSKAYKSSELTDELIDIYIDLSKMLLVHGNNKNKRMLHRYEQFNYHTEYTNFINRLFYCINGMDYR